MAEEKEKKTATASVHGIPAEEYKEYRKGAIDWGFRSVSKFLLHLAREGKKRIDEARDYLPPSNLDWDDAVTLVEGGVPDRYKHKNAVEAFKKGYNFNDYDSVLKYQQDVKQWKETNRQKRRHYEILDELLDEELDWVEHKIDELKG